MDLPVTQYAKSGEVYVAYQVFGSGSFDLVFMPGWTSNLDLWWDNPLTSNWLRGLARFSRVIMFDKRGTGLSDRSVGPPGMEQRMDDIRAVMDAAASPRAAVLGISEGGSLAALFAATELIRFRGKEIKSLGDGFLATFDGPARAVHCALSIIEAVRALGIEVRAGVHTGEIELEESDIGGIGVHIAARVVGHAAAGECLVSRTLKDLVVGANLRFADHGSQHLKGLAEPMNLFAVSQ